MVGRPRGRRQQQQQRLLSQQMAAAAVAAAKVAAVAAAAKARISMNGQLGWRVLWWPHEHECIVQLRSVMFMGVPRLHLANGPSASDCAGQLDSSKLGACRVSATACWL